MVNTMPTKAAVSSETPSEAGPTKASCSFVFRQCSLPAQEGGTCVLQRSHPCSEHGRLAAAEMCTHRDFVA